MEKLKALLEEMFSKGSDDSYDKYVSRVISSMQHGDVAIVMATIYMNSGAAGLSITVTDHYVDRAREIVTEMLSKEKQEETIDEVEEIYLGTPSD